MAREFKVFKCPYCGNIITVMNDGGGELVCCGKPMLLLVAGENDTAAKEKHIPVVTVLGEVIEVAVGSVAHPMTPEHYIQWIAVVTDSEVYTKYLTPADAPKAVFALPVGTTDFAVYEYCNLHGLWKA
jgi:superoxide reductase